MVAVMRLVAEMTCQDRSTKSREARVPALGHFREDLEAEREIEQTGKRKDNSPGNN